MPKLVTLMLSKTRSYHAVHQRRHWTPIWMHYCRRNWLLLQSEYRSGNVELNAVHIPVYYIDQL